MPWARLDDRYDDNPKVKRAWRENGGAVGLHVMAISYASRHETDGLVPLDWFEEKCPSKSRREKAIETLVSCELLEPHAGGFLVHDFLDYNPSRAAHGDRRDWDRRRKSLFRDRGLVAAIRTRDGNHCRYCDQEVNWTDRKSPRGGTYDHIEPRGPNSLENLVVACHGCNSRKGGRTPEQAAMSLLAPRGSSPDLDPDLVRDLDPIQIPIQTVPTRARAGSGRAGSSSEKSFQGEMELDARAIDEACSILEAAVNEPNRAQVENAGAMYPLVDVRQGCRLALTWLGGEDWKLPWPATLRAAMRKLDDERPRLAADAERRKRRGVALQSLMGQTESA